MIGWSVDPTDWKGTPSDRILQVVKKQARPGGIVLLHSSGGKGGKLDNTVKALPDIIAFLQKQGYTFVTVPELLEREAKSLRRGK